MGVSVTSFLVFKSTTTKFSRSRLAMRPLSNLSTSAGDDTTGRSGLRTCPIRRPSSSAASMMQAFASPMPLTFVSSCTETSLRPCRPPAALMTSPASSTAVFSRLPIPNKSPRSSPSESAEGPAVRSRSRGLSSGGSCFMVYLRRSIFSPLIPTNTELLKYTAREREREAHHVGVVALDPLYEERRFPLYGVPPGLPDALPELDVGGDLGFSKLSEVHPRHLALHDDVLPARHRHAGVDLVGAAFEDCEHPAHIVPATGLPQSLALLRQVDDCIGGEHDLVRDLKGDGEGLAAGVHFDSLCRLVEKYLGEAAFLGLEVVADHS